MRTPERDWTQPVRRDVANRYLAKFDDGTVRLLCHMVGLDRIGPKLPNMYRDYAAVNPGDKNFVSMAANGLVRFYYHRDRYDYYETTDAGKDVALAWFWSHRPTKKSRVYRLWRLLTWECGYQFSFLEFLQCDDPEIAKAREEA